MAETSSDLIFSPSASEYAKYFAGVESLGTAIDYRTLFMLQMKMQSSISGLLHLTKNLQDIGESGVVYPSAGGLGGVVYSVPVCGKTIHNLGSYLLKYEIPFFTRATESSRQSKSAVFFPAEKPRLGLVDYLAFGKTYQEIYALSDHLQMAIHPDELAHLVTRNQRVVSELKQYLMHINAGRSHTPEAFETFLAESPLVQMLYFELMLEFVYLSQDDANSQEAMNIYELYNNNAKQLVFDLNPELAKGFSLKKITSPLGRVEKYLKQMSSNGAVIRKYKEGQFTSYVSSRLYQQLEYYFQNEQNLLGHVLFRCFNERRAFESQLAEKLWKEAEQKGVHALTYRIPKGEIGLLPGKYLAEMGLIANGQFIKQSAGDLFVPRKFASNISGTMRNPYDDIQ